MGERESPTLALELLHEVKKSSKRWFAIFIITLIALFGTNIAWFIYESQFEIVNAGETTTVEGGPGMTTYLEDSNSGDIKWEE